MLKDFKGSKDEDSSALKAEIKALRERLLAQQQLVRDQKLPVIVLVEGWAAAGKGSLINELISEIDPRFYNVISPVVLPEKEERYPFLYQYASAIPENGKIMFYDSGWMEGAVRKFLRRDITKKQYKERIRSVNEFERQLRDGGYLILKLFLHIDQDEQRKRLNTLRENYETEWRVTEEDLWQHREYKLFRETYEGTEFDMTRNWKLARPAGRDHEADTVVSPLANPWLTTTMRNTLNTIAPGTIDFKRTVAVAWCAYSHVTQLRSWLPDAIGGICWLSVDNPAQSPRIPVFCGTTVLPEGFWTCGQNSYSENSALWSFRRANKLATLSWQTTKEGFNKEVMRLEDLAFEGLPSSEASPSMLNSYTAFIYNEAVRSWKAMEEKYWMQFGMGF